MHRAALARRQETGGGSVGKYRGSWSSKVATKGPDRHHKNEEDFFWFTKVCFTSGDFALKNNTSRRLPTHCIIHYLFFQCEWHLRMGTAIMHAEDPTVNS